MIIDATPEAARAYLDAHAGIIAAALGLYVRTMREHADLARDTWPAAAPPLDDAANHADNALAELHEMRGYDL